MCRKERRRLALHNKPISGQINITSVDKQKIKQMVNMISPHNDISSEFDYVSMDFKEVVAVVRGIYDSGV